MGAVVVGSPPRVLVGWSEARWSCAGHFEEDPVGGCRYSFYCCVSCGCRFADRCVSFVGHPDRHHIDHNRHSGHRDSDHSGHPICVGCRFGNHRHCDGNRRPDVVYQVIVVDRYLGPGRIVARPDESMYSWARSGGLVLSFCD